MEAEVYGPFVCRQVAEAFLQRLMTDHIEQPLPAPVDPLKDVAGAGWDLVRADKVSHIRLLEAVADATRPGACRSAGRGPAE